MDIIFCSSGLHLHLIWNGSDEEASWWIDAPRKRGKTKPFPKIIIIATSHSTNWHFKWMYRGLYGIISSISHIYPQAPITTLSVRFMGQSKLFILIDQMCTVVIDGRHQPAPEDHITSWWLEGSIHKKIINNNMSRWSIDVASRTFAKHYIPVLAPKGTPSIACLLATTDMENPTLHKSLCASIFISIEAGGDLLLLGLLGSHIFPSRLYPVFY